MCGIAGWLSWGGALDRGAFDKVVGSLAHRGPDFQSVAQSPYMLLGHTRLSIIDVSSASHQPMHDHTRRLSIVYNGEIYNYKELRSQLVMHGARFITDSDTEVILEAYKYWGHDCVERFNGMFAFAIWDEAKQSLWVARDRMGEKPLFYALTPDGVVFASELPSLLLFPGCKKELNIAQLGSYLTLGYDGGDECLVAGVKRLAPATSIRFSRGAAPELTTYWNLAAHFLEKKSFTSSQEAAQKFNALFDDSVRLRLVSDVPLGAFLSGGIDSSAIVASMTRAMPADAIHTFTMGFKEHSFDETDYARMVAEHLRVRNHHAYYDVHQDGLHTALEWSARDPLADTSFIPSYALSEFTSSHVKVALSGDGGDECLGGYETYIADKLHHTVRHIPHWALQYISQGIDWLMPVTFNKVGMDYKLRQFAKGMMLSSRRAHLSWRYLFSDGELRDLIDPQWLEHIQMQDPFETIEHHFESVKGAHFLDQAMYIDMKTWLANDILVKVDRATMAHGLESRAPFLDHRLVEFCASLPVHYKVNGFTKKALLKRSQAERLPKDLLHRSKKGFNAPLAHWLCGPLREYGYEIIQHQCLKPFIRQRALQALWSDHQKKLRDNSFKLLSLMCFSLWLQKL